MNWFLATIGNTCHAPSCLFLRKSTSDLNSQVTKCQQYMGLTQKPNQGSIPFTRSNKHRPFVSFKIFSVILVPKFPKRQQWLDYQEGSGHFKRQGCCFLINRLKAKELRCTHEHLFRSDRGDIIPVILPRLRYRLQTERFPQSSSGWKIHSIARTRVVVTVMRFFAATL